MRHLNVFLVVAFTVLFVATNNICQVEAGRVVIEDHQQYLMSKEKGVGTPSAPNGKIPGKLTSRGFAGHTMVPPPPPLHTPNVKDSTPAWHSLF